MHLYQYRQKEITQHPLMCSEHPQGPSGLQGQLHTLRGAHPECKQPKNRNRQKTISRRLKGGRQTYTDQNITFFDFKKSKKCVFLIMSWDNRDNFLRVSCALKQLEMALAGQETDRTNFFSKIQSEKSG